jgi:hypothetical protein
MTGCRSVTLLAVAVALSALLVMLIAMRAGSQRKTSAASSRPPESSGTRGTGKAPPPRAGCSQPPPSPIYSSEDVDELVTGRLYEHSDGMRWTYSQRTADPAAVDEDPLLPDDDSPPQGLIEYSSSGGEGDVGVDVGGYGPSQDPLDIPGGYDDGIPEEYAFPSTPVKWYSPRQRDYYGPEGPTPYKEGIYPVFTQDHDLLVN